MGSSKSKPSDQRTSGNDKPASVVETRKHVGHFSLLPSREALVNEDEGMGDLSYLPTEIKIQVLKFLQVEDLLILSSCSISLFDLCSADYIWKKMFEKIDTAYREERISRYCCWKRRTILSYHTKEIETGVLRVKSQLDRLDGLASQAHTAVLAEAVQWRQNYAMAVSYAIFPIWLFVLCISKPILSIIGLILAFPYRVVSTIFWFIYDITVSNGAQFIIKYAFLSALGLICLFFFTVNLCVLPVQVYVTCYQGWLLFHGAAERLLTAYSQQFKLGHLDLQYGSKKATLDKIQIRNWKREKRSELEKELHRLRARDLQQWRERQKHDQTPSSRSLKELDDKYRGYITLEDVRKEERKEHRRVAQRATETTNNGCIIS